MSRSTIPPLPDKIRDLWKKKPEDKKDTPPFHVPPSPPPMERRV